MPNEQLVAHIRDEFAQGVERTAVIRSLLGVGWKVEDINAAIAVIDPIPTVQTPPIPQSTALPVASAYVAVQSAVPVSTTKVMIQDLASGLFIACVTVLTAISILGVWDVFSTDVIWKSFETLGLLAIVSMIVVVAGRYSGDPSAVAVSPTPNPLFRAIRNITVVTLIVSATFLALLGVLAIWDVISDSATVNKSLASLAILTFSSLVIVAVCSEREQLPPKKKVK